MKERDIFYTVLSDYATTREDVDVFQWGKDDVLCMDYLRRSLCPRLVMTYGGCKTAKELWDRLNAHFQQEEGSLRIPLSEQFFNFIFDTNSSITSQIVELEKLRLKLADEQSVISDSLFVSLILHKLPPGWITS
ncbi:hypothetical protein KSP39_PZI005080 [Platanthera zijinensis]|uniref:Uncharacterized protein n=1 Tax=Platanthera zijinensis TaxID=2320716 RepID=A0AAP0GAL1_9ASPA